MAGGATHGGVAMGPRSGDQCQWMVRNQSNLEGEKNRAFEIQFFSRKIGNNLLKSQSMNQGELEGRFHKRFILFIVMCGPLISLGTLMVAWEQEKKKEGEKQGEEGGFNDGWPWKEGGSIL